MATPNRIGAHVSLSDEQESLGLVVYDIVDEKGKVSQIPSAGGDTNLEVAAFVELDDGRRVTAESGMVGLGPLSSLAELEDEMREHVFEDEIRDVATTDEEVGEMLGEIEDLIAALAREGRSF